MQTSSTPHTLVPTQLGDDGPAMPQARTPITVLDTAHALTFLGAADSRYEPARARPRDEGPRWCTVALRASSREASR